MWVSPIKLVGKGETHLLIVPDSEHSMSTGVPEVASALSAFAGSIIHSTPTRPTISFTYDSTTGSVAVQVDSKSSPSKVVLHTAKTLQQERRDFRWVRLANNQTGACVLPDVPLPKPVFGGNCLQPIFWTHAHLNVSASGLYEFTPDKNTPKWMGYYIEVFFPSDIGIKEHFQFSTPGFVWPDTLPYSDCTGEACYGYLM